MTVPGKLAVGSDGRLTGPARIEYNNPFPCVNGSWGSGAMMGAVFHTMVGDLPGTITVFNDPNYQASAHFGIDQTGLIHQFGPIGKGWIAWHAEAANATWYGIEHADHGNPDNPLTSEQITASAQLVECLSAFASFPLAEANTPAEKGFGVHYMGGAAWGGHTCPDLPPQHVRSAQRPEILALAAQIRGGVMRTWQEWTAQGELSLREFAAPIPMSPATFLRVQVAHYGAFNGLLYNYVNAGNWDAKLPAGTTLWTLA